MISGGSQRRTCQFGHVLFYSINENTGGTHANSRNHSRHLLWRGGHPGRNIGKGTPHRNSPGTSPEWSETIYSFQPWRPHPGLLYNRPGSTTTRHPLGERHWRRTAGNLCFANGHRNRGGRLMDAKALTRSITLAIE